MLPTATDLDDPDGFVHREQLDFSELDKMLGEAAGGAGPDLRKKDAGEKNGGEKAEGDGGEGDGTE
jgi:hypothetical protein